MSKTVKQVVILLHGVGNQKAGYSHEFQNLIKKRFASGTGKESDAMEILFKEICWSDITSRQQADLLSRIISNLSWSSWRTFFVSFAGDTIASRKGGNWEKIKERIDKAISDAKKEYPDHIYEFTFVSHSLGTILVNDYLVEKGMNNSEVINIFTLGSPLAVWSLIDDSPASVPELFRVHEKHGVWINILDSDDVIAYPLQNVHPSYKEAVSMDYYTEVGNIIQQSTPLSHTKYWSDRNVIKPIAKKLIMDFDRIKSGDEYKEDEYLKYIRKLLNV